MIGCLESIRRQCQAPSDAVRWACLIEATSPKAGNVYPGRCFSDLCYADFVTAAELSAESFHDASRSFSHGVLQAAVAVADQIGTNVNLGILLLIGPLVQTDQLHTERIVDHASWQSSVADVLSAITPEDTARLYSAINAASPGGMGETDDMDLTGPPPKHFVDAMSSAQSRDRIARNYANEFRDLFGTVAPLLADSIQREKDLLSGTALAHLRLLESEPDSLIERKFGLEVAKVVQQRAMFDHQDPEQCVAFDRFLREGEIDLAGNRSKLNPGTTADLIAAGLYILLRELPR